MRDWPPAIKYKARPQKKLRAWNFSADGAFWGALLIVLMWGTTCGFIVVMVMQQQKLS
ncbi:hypothetical protein ACFWOT_09000 [Streptomyces sp. NPDC058440]|uniref:hypothetical protein n=1 Tax=Streptomyces sp. NPDC058440 TaxID=3346501 RepID=UPI00364EEE73